MKVVMKELKAQGITIPNVPYDETQPAYFDVDCPKPYCQNARQGIDPNPLKVCIQPGYAEWKCRHCLQAGHIGKKPTASFDDKKEEVTEPEETKTIIGLLNIDHAATSVVLCQRAKDRTVLMKAGCENVLALPNEGISPKGSEYETSPDKFWYLSGAADRIKGWNKIVFVFDDTPQGLSLRQELARRMGMGKCYSATLSKGTVQKTLSELGNDELLADINEAKPLPIFGLYEVDDFQKELFAYFDTGMAAGVGTGWPNVDKLYTVMPGQLTVVTGIPNSGKSEWVDALTLNLALNHGWRFAAFSPENGKEAHATKLIEKRVEMSADPKSKDRMSFDTFYNGSLWVRKHYSFIESTEEMPTLDWILERAADAALRNGIKGLIIDPWNRIEKKMDGFRAETDYVAFAIPRILRFLVNYGVHGWLVVHPKQQEKDRKTGKIPAPSLYDMAGSAHFVNMADNGIVIHRSDSIDDTTEVHVKKVRFKHIGRRGETKLSYNLTTGRYVPLDQAPAQYTYGGDAQGDGIKTYEV